MKNDQREIVLDILLDIEKNKEYANAAIGRALRVNQFQDKRTRAFVTRLAEGVTEYRIRLDYIINAFSNTKVNKQKPLIRCVLRMAVYQIFFMDSVPPEVAVNEAARLTGSRGFKNLKGFVNAVLRNICRNKDNIVYPDRSDDVRMYFSVMYSVPLELVDILLEDYDEHTVEEILISSYTDRDVSIRVNTDLISVKEFTGLLEEAGITVRPGEYNSTSLFIKNYDYIRRVPGFFEGYFTVQDESSALAVVAAGIKPGDNIIDLCAAPGGKTMYAALLTGKEGHVISGDISQSKVELIDENLSRLKIENVTTRCHDARQTDDELIETADVVIADLPCSGLGIMGRKNDIKYNVTRESISSLVELQREILKASAGYVRPGGKLIYSTCTIDKAENEENVKWFLENFDFTLASMRNYLPPKLAERGEPGYMTLLQGIDAGDGFFIALFERNK